MKQLYIILCLISINLSAQELLKNGDFQTGDATDWTPVTNGHDIRTDGSNSYYFANVETAGAAYTVNLSQNVALDYGVKYTLSFKASTDAATASRTIIAGIGLSVDPYTNNTEIVTITSTEQTFTYELYANFQGSPTASRVLFDMGAATGIVVIDDVSLKVAATAAPTTNATTPTKDAENVISIFSDAYTDIASNYNPFWGQKSIVNTTYDPTGNSTNYALEYSKLDYQGTTLNVTDASAMEYLHIDLWTDANPTTTTIKITPINGGDTATGAAEFLFPVEYTSKNWVSVDIPKASFTGMTWNSVKELKITSNNPDGSVTGVTVYLDNIYFWKEAAVPATDATLSDLKVDGATINSFESSILSYTYELVFGTTTVPEITAATATEAGTGATVSITQATAIPGNATILVTAPNGTTKKTYTVSFVANIPADAAPTPPNRNAADVLSIYGDAYGTAVGLTNVTWDNAEFIEETIAENKALKVTFSGGDFLGTNLNTQPTDASTMTHFHLDYWIADDFVVGQTLTAKWSNHAGGGGETSAILKKDELVAADVQTWKSMDVDISTLTSTTRNELWEFIVTAANSTNSISKIYIDNVYFYKGTPLSINEFDGQNKISIYPNPAENEVTISAAQVVEHVSIYDLTGRQVLSATPNAAAFSLNVSNLNKGVYLVSIKADGQEMTAKLVK